jgi:transposase
LVGKEYASPRHDTISRGKRVYILAAMDVKGFVGWGDVDGTFTRSSFHEVFKSKILPFLNPWPLPRSIVVMDNAKIHMYKELQDMIHETGALLFFLPPCSPDLNPIEVGFSLLKRCQYGISRRPTGSIEDFNAFVHKTEGGSWREFVVTAAISPTNCRSMKASFFFFFFS